MPELPELDVMVEVLKERVLGREIMSARAYHPGMLKTVDPGLDNLVGASFQSVSRRAKHLIFTLREDLSLVVHLMLAGRMVLCKSDTKITKATGGVFSFSDGEDLRVIENATKHRARIHVVRAAQEVPAIAAAGIEPTDRAFTAEKLAELLNQRRQLKKLLTEQSRIAGIGTAYADEILFDAKLSPIKYGTTLEPDEIERLHDSIQRVLAHAIEQIRAKAGGAALTPHIRDFVQVYKKTDQPCPNCGTKIAEIRYAQTKTYYCPSCQAEGKSIKDRRAWLTR